MILATFLHQPWLQWLRVTPVTTGTLSIKTAILITVSNTIPNTDTLTTPGLIDHMLNMSKHHLYPLAHGANSTNTT